MREKSIVAAGTASGMEAPENLLTPPDVEKALLKLGVGYTVVESLSGGALANDVVAVRGDMDRKDFGVDPIATQRALRSDKFELVKEVEIRSSDGRTTGVKLMIYRTKAPTRPRVAEIAIPMAALSQDIQLPLSRIAGQPWPPPQR